MNRAFVDTGAWYALLDKNDPDHARVAATFRAYRGRLVTSNFVFDEAITVVRYRLRWEVAKRLGEQLREQRVARLELGDIEGRSRRLVCIRPASRQAVQLHGLHQLRSRSAPELARLPGHRFRFSVFRAALLAEPGLIGRVLNDGLTRFAHPGLRFAPPAATSALPALLPAVVPCTT